MGSVAFHIFTHKKGLDLVTGKRRYIFVTAHSIIGVLMVIPNFHSSTMKAVVNIRFSVGC
jgi:hypothetical protein